MIELLRIAEIDFYADWVEVAYKRLIDHGFDIDALPTPPNQTRDEKIGLAYFNALLHMTIAARPRHLHKAEGLVCPAGYEDGLRMIEEKIAAGISLLPHMSLQTKKLDKHDSLLYDWGIHHFHLGTEYRPDGYVLRTGPLLFAWVTNDAVYLLGVMNHGSWTKQQLLLIIHNNWPHLLTPYQIGSTDTRLNFHPTDAEIARLRKCQVNVILKIAEGVHILGPGGGISASGHSTEAVSRLFETRRQLRRLAKEILDLTSLMVVEPLQKQWITNPHLCYSLVDAGGSGYRIIETNNDFEYYLQNTDGGLPPD